MLKNSFRRGTYQYNRKRKCLRHDIRSNNSIPLKIVTFLHAKYKNKNYAREYISQFGERMDMQKRTPEDVTKQLQSLVKQKKQPRVVYKAGSTKPKSQSTNSESYSFYDN